MLVHVLQCSEMLRELFLRRSKIDRSKIFPRYARPLYMATPLLGTFRCPCYPMDRAIIMICDMQYVIGRANALCDVNTLWAARMRYANALWTPPLSHAIGKASVTIAK